jgi:hypothetical protein
MISNEVGQQLHDRATRGEPLSEEEQALLDAWYARQDAEEAEQLAAGRLEHETSLREGMKNLLVRMTLLTRKMQETIEESEQLNKELAALYEQSLEEEVADIRQAYPLMDAVARREGWDDPEMDSYDIYARKPQR